MRDAIVLHGKQTTVEEQQPLLMRETSAECDTNSGVKEIGSIQAQGGIEQEKFHAESSADRKSFYGH